MAHHPLFSGSKKNQKSADPSDPLSYAVQKRDAETLEMVSHALANNKVILAFQPIVHSRKQNKPAFYEALIRVLDQSGRIIPAKYFMNVAEETEMGRIIDCLALELGLQTLAENPGIRLSVNMSARSIDYKRWRKTLDRGLDLDVTIGERLILEVTEQSAMSAPEETCAFMRDVQSCGVSFALDDFGAGQTSFRYLRDFYFDILKIDGQFIRGINSAADNQVLVEAMTTIAQQFDMLTIAEFVETAKDADYLTEMGIDCLQGYFFGAPTTIPPWIEPQSAQMRA